MPPLLDLNFSYCFLAHAGVRHILRGTTEPSRRLDPKTRRIDSERVANRLEVEFLELDAPYNKRRVNATDDIDTDVALCLSGRDVRRDDEVHIRHRVELLRFLILLHLSADVLVSESLVAHPILRRLRLLETVCLVVVHHGHGENLRLDGPYFRGAVET